MGMLPDPADQKLLHEDRYAGYYACGHESPDSLTKGIPKAAVQPRPLFGV